MQLVACNTTISSFNNQNHGLQSIRQLTSANWSNSALVAHSVDRSINHWSCTCCDKEIWTELTDDHGLWLDLIIDRLFTWTFPIKWNISTNFSPPPFREMTLSLCYCVLYKSQESFAVWPLYTSVTDRWDDGKVKTIAEGTKNQLHIYKYKNILVNRDYNNYCMR